MIRKKYFSVICLFISMCFNLILGILLYINAALKMYNGMLYRNGCMLFIPYLEDEYKFPTIDDVNEYVKTLMSEE